MGYLDKTSRVVDIQLTKLGRLLYATGDLDFSFFALFDDGVDYDPWSNSGSLSDDDREVQIESTPMLEVSSVPYVRGATAPGEPVSHLFTAAGGYQVVPQMVVPLSGTVLSLGVDQRSVDGGFVRTAPSAAPVDMQVKGDVERGNPGFLVRLFASGTNGLTEVNLRRDLVGRRSFDPYVAVSVDDESTPSATTDDPTTSRTVIGPLVKR